MNYKLGILPRSQDMIPVIEETTGMYGITKDAVSKYRCKSVLQVVWNIK